MASSRTAAANEAAPALPDQPLCNTCIYGQTKGVCQQGMQFDRMDILVDCARRKPMPDKPTSVADADPAQKESKS